MSNWNKATELLNEGKPVYREGWNGKKIFVFAQVPSTIDASIIEKMTSLPQAVKDLLVVRRNYRERQVDENPHWQSLKYSNQYCIVSFDNRIHSWHPSISDLNGNDWKEYKEEL